VSGPGIAVILPAGGLGTRFGSDKLSAMLGGQSVLSRTVAAFAGRGDVSQVVIATRTPDAVAGRLAADGVDATRIVYCPGGSCRAASVANALAATDASAEWVAVHDAARPLVSQRLIDRVLQAARAHGAAAAALPVSLTIKRSTAPLPAPVISTVPRDGLFAMQTPQVARRADLLAAIDRCPIPLEQVTDDLQLLELAGKPVWLVEGDPENLKITHSIDLALAAAILAQRRPQP
jgi:2-C-methyl-D-erythritol 4-phosphate cytidylyltransferase